MKQKLICLILPMYMISLNIFQKRESILVLPNIQNKLTPFSISFDNEYDKLNTYSFSAKCNSSFESNLIFIPSNTSICDKTFQFSSNSLQNYLQDTKVTLQNDIQNSSLVYIDYSLKYIDENKNEQVFNLRQNLKLVQEIPTTKLVDQFDFVLGSESEFNIEVLEISQIYQQNSPSFNFQIKTSQAAVPTWVQTTFNQDKLIFWGKVPKIQTENISFSYYILDTETKLTSEINSFYFKQKNVVQSESESNQTFISMIILCSIVYGFVIIYLIIMTQCRQKQQKLKNFGIQEIKQEQQENVDRENNLSLNSEEHALKVRSFQPQLTDKQQKSIEKIKNEMETRNRLSDLEEDDQNNQFNLKLLKNNYALRIIIYQ